MALHKKTGFGQDFCASHGVFVQRNAAWLFIKGGD
jgi:hypothetical protein